MTTIALGKFTQTDPLQADVGSPYPSAYVYGNNNPLVYTDPPGMRGQSTTCTTRVPIKSATPQRLALTAPGGPQFDCGSLRSIIREKVFWNKRQIGNGRDGRHGLMFRFQEFFIDGVVGGQTKFNNHVDQYEGQRRGLNRDIDKWKDNCPDDDPPSSVEILDRVTVFRWAATAAPTWAAVQRASMRPPPRKPFKWPTIDLPDIEIADTP